VKAVYLETSALLQWLLGQPDAGSVREVLDGADTVVTSVLTLTESERALIRACESGLLEEGDARRLRGILNRAEAAWVRSGVTRDVLARAARPFPVEPVRTLDAIHLATALEFTLVYPDLRVLSFDRRVRDNAEALGIL
jgi:predicted nucleic acid-binding protein